MQRNMFLRGSYAIVGCLTVSLWCAAGAVSAPSSDNTVPLLNAHAHNDYRHERPLLDALEHGFTSVECDVFLRDGRLLVGHEEKELQPGRTLESLYLRPLTERVAANHGHVYGKPSRFFLLIDIKSDPQPSYARIHDLLVQYVGILTTWEDNVTNPGAVTVVITGARPRVKHVEDGKRYAGMDGRLTDLNSTSPSHQMPMISARWSSHFNWTGNGPIPKEERAKLREIVRKAHASERVVRFWGTPEKEIVWHELLDAGVDLINSDELGRLEHCLRTRAERGM